MTKNEDMDLVEAHMEKNTDAKGRFLLGKKYADKKVNLVVLRVGDKR